MSSTPPPPLVCVVCKATTQAFNFPVPCCDSCHQFFRSVFTTRTPIVQCNLQCGVCRTCRFQKCIDAGMRAPFNQSTQLCMNMDNLRI